MNFMKMRYSQCLTPIVIFLCSLITALKASAHSFKRFISRLLKVSFPLSMHLLPRMNVMLDFI